jgi:hypothetical protein
LSRHADYGGHWFDAHWQETPGAAMATATNCARLALALVTMMPQLVEH